MYLSPCCAKACLGAFSSHPSNSLCNSLRRKVLLHFFHEYLGDNKDSQSITNVVSVRFHVLANLLILMNNIYIFLRYYKLVFHKCNIHFKSDEIF
jgi:hypothetical protein